jgi:hypothetical protein
MDQDMSILTNGRIGRLLHPLRRAAQLRRARGTARTVYAVINRIVQGPVLGKCLHICAVDYWRLPLDENDAPARKSALFDVRFAHQQDTDLLAEYFGDRHRVLRRLARGDRCVVAISKGAIGAAVWLGIGPGEFVEDWLELRCAFQFPRGVAWSYDGKGTRLGAWGTMMKQLPFVLRAVNVREVATIIDCNNWQSTDGHRSLGYQSLGVLLHVRLLGLPSLHLFRPANGRWQRLPSHIDRVSVCH